EGVGRLRVGVAYGIVRDGCAPIQKVVGLSSAHEDNLSACARSGAREATRKRLGARGAAFIPIARPPVRVRATVEVRLHEILSVSHEYEAGVRAVRAHCRTERASLTVACYDLRQ